MQIVFRKLLKIIFPWYRILGNFQFSTPSWHVNTIFVFYSALCKLLWNSCNPICQHRDFNQVFLRANTQYKDFSLCHTGMWYVLNHHWTQHYCLFPQDLWFFARNKKTLPVIILTSIFEAFEKAPTGWTWS